jgi:hypothetical protein
VRRVVSVLLAVAVLSGCSAGGKGAPAPPPSAGPVKTMTHAQAQALAGRYRDEAAGAIGAPLRDRPTDSLVPCEGPHTFAALTYGDVPVAADQQAAALRRLREHYAAAKYTVDPAPSEDPGALNVTGPDRVPRRRRRRRRRRDPHQRGHAVLLVRPAPVSRRRPVSPPARPRPAPGRRATPAGRSPCRS